MRLILIVEDEEVIRFPLSKFFRKRGFAVLQADRLSVVQEYLNQGLLRELDVALVDGNLDKSTICLGVEVIAVLKRRLPSVQIIAMSGRSDNEQPMRAAGADEFRLKPFELEQLWQLVDQRLAGSGDSPPE